MRWRPVDAIRHMRNCLIEGGAPSIFFPFPFFHLYLGGAPGDFPGSIPRLFSRLPGELVPLVLPFCDAVFINLDPLDKIGIRQLQSPCQGSPGLKLLTIAQPFGSLRPCAIAPRMPIRPLGDPAHETEVGHPAVKSPPVDMVDFQIGRNKSPAPGTQDDPVDIFLLPANRAV